MRNVAATLAATEARPEILLITGAPAAALACVDAFRPRWSGLAARLLGSV